MSVLDDDLTNVFYNTSDEFTGAFSGTYKPNGAGGKTIAMILEDGIDEIFEAGDHVDCDQLIVRVRSEDNTVGHVAPTIMGRGIPDQILGIPDNALTVWYVAKVIEDGKKSKTKEHRLLIRNSPVPI